MTRDQLLRLPKAELHLHLRGAMPPEVLVAQLNMYPIAEALRGLPLSHKAMFRSCPNIRPFLKQRDWSLEEVGALFEYESYRQFLITYYFTGLFFRTVDDLQRLLAGVQDGLVAQNVVYAEITISLPDFLAKGITLDEACACLDESSMREDVRTQWIVDPVRDLGPEACLALVNDLATVDCAGLVGLTIGGSEDRHPPAPFADVYDAAREAGLRLSVHAGEALGPESVWDALNVLKAERIGHGVRSLEDPSLVAHLAETQVPLEVCPTSNLQTGIYASFDEHPVKPLFEAGVPVTINSDDPTFFHTTLTDELLHVHRMGVSESDMLTLIENGFRHAFLPDDEVDRYVADLRRTSARLVEG